MEKGSKRKVTEACPQNNIPKGANIHIIILDKQPQSQQDAIEMQIRTGAIHPRQQTALFYE